MGRKLVKRILRGNLLVARLHDGEIGLARRLERALLFREVGRVLAERPPPPFCRARLLLCRLSALLLHALHDGGALLLVGNIRNGLSADFSAAHLARWVSVGGAREGGAWVCRSASDADGWLRDGAVTQLGDTLHPHSQDRRAQNIVMDSNSTSCSSSSSSSANSLGGMSTPDSRTNASASAGLRCFKIS